MIFRDCLDIYIHDMFRECSAIDIYEIFRDCSAICIYEKSTDCVAICIHKIFRYFSANYKYEQIHNNDLNNKPLIQTQP